MKNTYRILLILLASFFFIKASAQSERKISFVGISSGIADFGKSETITSAFYHFQPTLGFFVHENLALGFVINISSFGHNNYPFDAVGLGPFARVTGNNLFFQAGYDFGLATDELFSYSKLTLSGGYTLHILRSFAIEPQVFYVHQFETGYKVAGLGAGLGLQFYFYKYE